MCFTRFLVAASCLTLYPVNDALQAIAAHQAALRACRRCPDMQPPVITGLPVRSPVLLIGQAPGAREGALGRPFAWTAGKTLFQWFAGIGLEEAAFRQRVYMAAVCRCFPGKQPRGGDRVPSPREIANCRGWLERELVLLRPRLVIPVGKLAIQQFLPAERLVDVIGRVHRGEAAGLGFDLLPLPHPSGASTWHRTAPGKDLLAAALDLLGAHPAWRELSAA
jgi:uracil-DNA glycosylase